MLRYFRKKMRSAARGRDELGGAGVRRPDLFLGRFFFLGAPPTASAEGQESIASEGSRRATTPFGSTIGSARIARRSPTEAPRCREEEKKDGNRYWQPDWQSPRCKACGAEFCEHLPRHHCRACGFIFCDDCSQHRRARVYFWATFRRVPTVERRGLDRIGGWSRKGLVSARRVFF